MTNETEQPIDAIPIGMGMHVEFDPLAIERSIPILRQVPVNAPPEMLIAVIKEITEARQTGAIATDDGVLLADRALAYWQRLCRHDVAKSLAQQAEAKAPNGKRKRKTKPAKATKAPKGKPAKRKKATAKKKRTRS